MPPTAGLTAKLFGTRFLATLFGLTWLCHQIGGISGAWLGGLAVVSTGNYQWMWWADAVLALATALVNLPIKEARLTPRLAAAQPRANCHRRTGARRLGARHRAVVLPGTRQGPAAICSTRELDRERRTRLVSPAEKESSRFRLRTRGPTSAGRAGRREPTQRNGPLTAPARTAAQACDAQRCIATCREREIPGARRNDATMMICTRHEELVLSLLTGRNLTHG